MAACLYFMFFFLPSPLFSSFLYPLLVILTEYGEEVGGGGRLVGEDELEDGEGEEDGDAEGHLLPGVRRQPEHEQRQRHDHYTRAQDVQPVVRSLTW